MPGEYIRLRRDAQLSPRITHRIAVRKDATRPIAIKRVHSAVSSGKARHRYQAGRQRNAQKKASGKARRDASNHVSDPDRFNSAASSAAIGEPRRQGRGPDVFFLLVRDAFECRSLGVSS